MPTKLGQNFLRDKSVVDKIISAANLRADDFVIEIGPGEGVLTEKLSAHAKKVIAIEIDKNLCDLLRSLLRSKKNVEVINEDILKINLRGLLCPQGSTLATAKVEPLRRYKVIANLPYYITSPIIRLFLESEFPPSEMILMVQKEVAERIVEKPGKMSILTVSVQYYAQPELLFYVDKKSFEPVPEVDSCVIRITPYHSPLPKRGEGESREKFFQIVRAGFSAKRKMLVNNLSNSFHLDKKEVEEKIKKIGLSPKVRAQELSVEDWKKLTEIFSQ